MFVVPQVLVLTLVVGTVLVTTAGTAGAQAAEETTLQDSTGFLWGTTTLEVAMLGTGVAMGVGDVCQGWGCTALLALVTVIAVPVSLGVGIGTGIADAPGEIPLVVHNSLWGGAAGLMLGTATARAFGFEDELGGTLITGGLTLAGIAGIGTWTFLRRGELLHDPGIAGAAYIVTWLPAFAATATLAITGLAEADEVLQIALAAAATIITFGVGIAWAESQFDGSKGTPATTGPLVPPGTAPATLSWGGHF